MHIESIVPGFNYVRIRRSGGVMGVDQTLHINDALEAVVNDRRIGTRTGSLDAYTANEMMTALARLARERPQASTAAGYDLFEYDIELAAGGTVFHISSVDLGADEALHGVMLAANRLLDGELEPIHPMSLHAVAHAAGSAS